MAAARERRTERVRGGVRAHSGGRVRAWMQRAAVGVLALAVLVLVPLRVLKIGEHASRSPGARDRGHPQQNAELAWTDRFGDGTPDFLRLTDPADQAAFRRWFTLIAMYQSARPKGEVPAEIVDCASLLRYAYREALKRHDAEWVMATGIEAPMAGGDVRAWRYPDTPLGMGLFRVTSGPFVAADAANGAFEQFADAKTLVERNAYLVSRDVRAALPGDLLFWRQFGQSSPWHSMIVTRVAADAEVVYDTGPDHGEPGEIRRVRIAELVEHPDARWRPMEGNPNFLGVYRWNILRGSE
ncbi:MAG TPA: DUF1175 family protein [Terracidiphilus sp.]|nr:DUF1175 family protein [Terracidiphilus sp.]